MSIKKVFFAVLFMRVMSGIIIIIIITYLLQLIYHSVAVILTLIQIKQIRINIHKRDNTKNTVQTIQNSANTSTHLHTYLSENAVHHASEDLNIDK
jgi:hypothetical protein